jgi:hypothetical protein
MCVRIQYYHQKVYLKEKLPLAKKNILKGLDVLEGTLITAAKK